jgi:unsaturated rhamnogalacturonyl hydrolase
MDTVAVEQRIRRVKTCLLAMQRHNWEQGVAAQAMLELGEEAETVALAHSAVMRQENGRFSVIGSTNPITDCASVGEAVVFAARLTGDPVLEEGVQAMLRVIRETDHRSANGTIYHTQEPTKHIMSDAAYMLPPFLAAAGEIDLALQQLEGYRSALWHPEDRLYSHIWDDESQSFVREAFWGVGNGWTAAGISRVIAQLPESRAQDRERLIGHVKELVDGCLEHLRADGLFHDVVDDESTFPEVNLSQMIAYTIYRGVSGGWLEEHYLEPADKMRNAAHEHVDTNGFVRDVCGLPRFNRPFVAPEGQAFFLLMEAARRDLGIAE